MRTINRTGIFAIMAALFALAFSACNWGARVPDLKQLSAPQNVTITDRVLTWDAVEHASGYTVEVGSAQYEVTETSYSLAQITVPKTYEVRVKAIGDVENYADSEWSASISYIVASTDQGFYWVEFDTPPGIVLPKINKQAGYQVEEPVVSYSGYNLVGWFYDAEGKTQVVFPFTLDKDYVLYGKWTPKNDISVIYNMQGGAAENVVRTVTFDAAYGPPPAVPTRAGYVFGGWWTESGASITAREIVFDTVVANDQPHTLYAWWTAEQAGSIMMTLSFDKQGGIGSVNTFVVIYGYAYGQISAVTKTGYTFGGWWTEPNGAGIEVYASTVVTRQTAHTLYAKWIAWDEDKPSVSVSFERNEGSGLANTIAVCFGDVYGPLPNGVSRTGYTFAGWWTDRNGMGVEVTESTAVVENAAHTLYAKWTPNGDIVVRFNKQNGLGTANDIIVTFNAAYGALPTEVMKIGYTFGGWWTEPNGGIQVIHNSLVAIGSAHTLYAKWMPDENISVSFDKQNGTGAANDIAVTYDAAYGTLPDGLEKIGYDFGGWWTEPNGGGTQVTELTIVKTIAAHTLYAKWVGKGNIAVSFDKQDGEGAAAGITVTVDAVYGILPGGLTKFGYDFGGWWTAPNGGGTEVVASTVVKAVTAHTLYAKWTLASGIVVSFDRQGGTGTANNISVTYDTAYGTLPSAVTKTGYDFDGWWTESNGGGTRVYASTKVDTVAAHTLYAKWTPKTFSVTLDRNWSGSGTSSITVTYDAPYGTLAEPVRGGYTFGGWWTGKNGAGTQITSDSTVKITSDQTLYAKWTAVSYTVRFEANGGTGTMANQARTYDDNKALPAATFVREDYRFVAWNTSASGAGGVQYEASSTGNLGFTAGETVILYAVWQCDYTYSSVTGGVKITGYAGTKTVLALPERIFDSFVVEIGTNAFLDKTTIISVTIPSRVKTIGTAAFSGCSGLELVSIPYGVEIIGDWAFSGCSSLRYIPIPRTVWGIGGGAINACSALRSVTIPSSVTHTGANIFLNCTQVTVFAEATSKPANWDANWNNLGSGMRPVIWGCDLGGDNYVKSILKNATNIDNPNGYTMYEPYRSGYTCFGWSLTSGGTTSVCITPQIPTIDDGTRLYAIWKTA